MDGKKFANLFYGASVCFYLLALVRFFAEGGSGGVIWLCLGSSFLCLGTVMKNKKSDNEEEKEK